MHGNEPGPVLAFDAAAEPASAAVRRPGGAILERVADPGQRVGSSLHLLLAEVLGAAGLRPADIRAVACTRGPGSFTALRVGLAAATGLARALGIPGGGYETTCVVALASGCEGRVGVLMNAGQGRLFAAVHEVGPGRTLRTIAAPTDVEPEEALARVVAEPATAWFLRGEAPCRDALVARGVREAPWPLAHAVLRLAEAGRDGTVATSTAAAPGSLLPLYLREPTIRAREDAPAARSRRASDGRTGGEDGGP